MSRRADKSNAYLFVPAHNRLVPECTRQFTPMLCSLQTSYCTTHSFDGFSAAAVAAAGGGGAAANGGALNPA